MMMLVCRRVFFHQKINETRSIKNSRSCDFLYIRHRSKRVLGIVQEPLEKEGSQKKDHFRFKFVAVEEGSKFCGFGKAREK